MWRGSKGLGAQSFLEHLKVGWLDTETDEFILFHSTMMELWPNSQSWVGSLFSDRPKCRQTVEV